MADAIVVLNAGSSSVKFSLFLVRGNELELWIRGQIEGISRAPTFVAKNAAGNTLAPFRGTSGLFACSRLMMLVRQELRRPKTLIRR